MSQIALFDKQLDEVNTIVQRAIVAGDPFIAANYGMELWASVKIKGKALAKLLYLMSENWDLFQSAGIEEEFENFAEANMDISMQTIRKYVRMWGAIFESAFVSDDVKRMLFLNPVDKLLLLAPAVEEGSVDDDDLKEIALLSKRDTSVRIREARGAQTSSRSAVHILLYVMDSRYPAGTFVAEQDGEHEEIGTLVLKPNTAFGARAVARVREAPGMIEIR